MDIIRYYRIFKKIIYNNPKKKDSSHIYGILFLDTLLDQKKNKNKNKKKKT